MTKITPGLILSLSIACFVLIQVVSYLSNEKTINPTDTKTINNRTCTKRYELEYKNGELIKVICEN